MAQTAPTARQAQNATEDTRGELIEGWTPSGQMGTPTMLDDEQPDLTGPILYWQNAEGQKVGIARCDKWASEGYPWVVLRYSNPVDGTPGWKYTHIAESRADARVAATRVADHREYLQSSKPGENYSMWVERTDGTEAV
jgi:hypothetical protein